MALAERLHASGCTDVGVLGDEDSRTYLLRALVRHYGARVSLRPVMVENATARLVRPGPDPCVLVSLAFDRRRGPENTTFARFRPLWHHGELALYSPAAAGPRASPEHPLGDPGFAHGSGDAAH